MNQIIPIRHPKENTYLFTKEAHELYSQIDSELLDSFWKYFEEEEQIFDEDDLIFYYMIRCWFCEENNPPKNEPIFDIDLPTNIKLVNIREVFNHPSHIIYKGSILPIDYDLEYAENFLTQYERQSDDESNQFDQDWWQQYDEIKKIIMDFIADL